MSDSEESDDPLQVDSDNIHDSSGDEDIDNKLQELNKLQNTIEKSFYCSKKKLNNVENENLKI